MRLEHSVSCCIISMVICSTLGIPVTAAEEVPIYNFGGRYFSITSDENSYAYGPEEQGVCDYGSFTSQCSVIGGKIVRNSRGVTLYPNNNPELPSQLLITISFDSPTDLSAVDFFNVDYSHSELETPLSGIFMKLENGARIGYFNGYSNRYGVRNSIGRLQTKIPAYELDGSSSDFVQQMIGVSQVTIEFLFSGDATVLAKSLGSWTLSKRAMHLKSRVESDSGDRMLAIESDRPIGPDELYRLELSSDLKNWQVNSGLIRGTGEKVLIKKRIPKAPWYRLSFFNYVDVDS